MLTATQNAQAIEIVKAHLGAEKVKEMDAVGYDWAKFVQMLMQFLSVLAPFLEKPKP